MIKSNRSKNESNKYDSIQSNKKSMLHKVIRLSSQDARRQVDKFIKE